MLGTASLDVLAQDVRFGLRMIGKSRGVSLVAVLSLAAGVGASTILFAFANAWLFRPLQVAKPAELLQVFTSDSEGGAYGGSSYPDYEDFREAAIFNGLLASTRAHAALSGAERSDVIEGVLVSTNYFHVLGLRPSLGRFFVADDGRTPGAQPVVVLSHRAWLRRFGADTRIVGRMIRLNGQPFTVLGVGPPAFSGTSIEFAADFFAPLALQPLISPGTDFPGRREERRLRLFGRLTPGVSLQEAGTALGVLASRLFQDHPDSWRDKFGRGRRVSVLPESEGRFVGAPPDSKAWILSSVLGGGGVLLGIACVNVATVLLARASTRRKEIAIRLAVGASRCRVVQQLLTECALLAGAGGAAGLALAQTLAVLFTRFRPTGVPPFDLSIDHRIVLFSAAASLLAVGLFGLAPALQTTRQDLTVELKDLARPVRVRRFRIGLRDGLVVVQVALSTALIIGAALMLRSVHAGRTEDPGFRRNGVLSVGIDLSTMANGGGARARFFREAVRSVGDLPGVEMASLAALVPLDGSNRAHRIEIGEGGLRRAEAVDTNIVGATYFELMNVPVVQGREFSTLDRDATPPVALVNKTMAMRFWNGDAIGRFFRDEESGADVRVVGIVGDLRHRSFAEAPLPMVYFSAGQRQATRMTLHVRTSVAPAAIGASVHRVLHELGPAAGIGRAETMAEFLDRVTMPQRMGGVAAGAVGVVELLLAVMALYGVIAYATSQRTREIGLRVALGAPIGSVTGLLMRHGVRLTFIGLVLGMVLALGAGQVAASLLIGVGSADPASFVITAVVLSSVAAVASYVPARRAARIDPGLALRAE